MDHNDLIKRLEMTNEEALEAAIKHWEENRDAEYPNQVRLSQQDCALCKIHYHGRSCCGCPVFEATQMDFCRFTPYTDAVAAFRIWRWATFSAQFKETRAAFRKAAQAEVNFLKGLRK